MAKIHPMKNIVGKKDIVTKISKRGKFKLKKRKLKEEGNISRSFQADQICSGDEDIIVGKSKMARSATKISKRGKLKLKKRKLKEEGNISRSCEADHISSGEEDISTRKIGRLESNDCAENTSHLENVIDMIRSVEPQDTHSVRKSKGKKAGKGRKKLVREQTSKENKPDLEVDRVDEISLVDEDCSRGMKKWLTEYYQNRPGLKILQQKIDDFITSHEVKEEQARKDKEALASEGGWTVVVHHKGRKKTTDFESGTTVGSFSQAAVTDKMPKKKSKEISLDFYRFQRREAQRNEIMMLQTKFEQDKKRIQQLRAARKFRPY